MPASEAMSGTGDIEWTRGAAKGNAEPTNSADSKRNDSAGFG